MRRRHLLLAIVVTCAGLAACGGSTGAACQPALPRLSSQRVALGDSIFLASTGLDCRPLFSGSQTYEIKMLPPGRPGGSPQLTRTVKLGSVRVGRTGAFRTAVRIPHSMPFGAAEIVVTGPQLNQREVCPPGADCALYGAGVYLTRSG